MFHKLLKTDLILMSAVALLLGISLVVLYSISTASGERGITSVFVRQCIYTFLGIVTMLFFTFTDHQMFKSRSTMIYLLTLIVLAGVLIFGTTVRGTSGWIGFGLFRIQPVEAAKIALIIFMASFISQKRMEFGEVGRIIVSSVLIGFMILLVAKQPDFGSAMVLTGVWIGMLLVSGMSRKLVATLAILGIAVSVFGWFQLADYQKARIYAFIDPMADAKGGGYNVIQSMVAVGSGGIFGKGIGHGSQSQLNFLPEKHTDFIFASISEELGLVGSAAVIGLLFVIFYRIRCIAKKAPDNFGYLVAIGILLMLFLQTLENAGMNMGIMPVTGIPLPFLSYGGSSLIAVLAAIGIVNNIHLRAENGAVMEHHRHEY